MCVTSGAKSGNIVTTIVTTANESQSHFLQTVCLKELAGLQMADLEITIQDHAPSCCDADLSVGG